MSLKSTAATVDRPKKLQRASRACDLCHRRSIRCRPSIEDPEAKCQNCQDFAVECTYNRPSRRGGDLSAQHGEGVLRPAQNAVWDLSCPCIIKVLD